MDFYATKRRLLTEPCRTKIAGDMQDNRGRLSFRLKNYVSITFQITTKSKLTIYHPKEITLEECLALVKPFLFRTDGKPVKFFKKICASSDFQVKERKGFQSEKERKKALKHSKTIFPEIKYGQDYVFISPQMIIDRIVFHDSKEKNVSLVINSNDKLLFQHIESGYPEVFEALTNYRKLMDETGLSQNEGFPKLKISEIPLPKGGPFPRRIPHEIISDENIKKSKILSLQNYLNSDGENPEIAKRYRLPKGVPKDKIKMLLNLRDLLNSQIGHIHEQLHKYNEPLVGACDNCFGEDIGLRQIDDAGIKK